MTTPPLLRDPPDAPGLPPYRPCVGVALFDARGRVFMGRRAPAFEAERVPDPYVWQMPQGGIDPGEDPYPAALRELHEETNVTSVELLAESPGWLAYDLPPEAVGGAWRGRWRGQRQRWYALRFTGPESEIDVLTPGGGLHEAEFTDWRWEALDRAPGLIVPFKRAVYEEVARLFAHLATA